ncbi:MAG TPA: non-canonical purine NTP pyrophosphatase [Candidatus Saccharimonadales bacterium]|nr:non-canonical purine NTP pyrophosphatase [Candidatus Saccharimonadales bacterium]
MIELTFVTGNQEKYHIARESFAAQDITLHALKLDVDEIQGEDGDRIVRDKVRRAYELAGKPVVVNDDSWAIHGLRGFPGPYMKSINHWFTAENFLNLTRGLEDRRVTLTQRIAYQDAGTQHVVALSYTGEILPEARGHYGSGWQKVITMPGDNGLSVAEAYDKGASVADREVSEGWQTFIAWYKEYAV